MIAATPVPKPPRTWAGVATGGTDPTRCVPALVDVAWRSRTRRCSPCADAMRRCHSVAVDGRTRMVGPPGGVGPPGHGCGQCRAPGTPSAGHRPTDASPLTHCRLRERRIWRCAPWPISAPARGRSPPPGPHGDGRQPLRAGVSQPALRGVPHTRATHGRAPNPLGGGTASGRCAEGEVGAPDAAVARRRHRTREVVARTATARRARRRRRATAVRHVAVPPLSPPARRDRRRRGRAHSRGR
jgi:hypothetical protein